MGAQEGCRKGFDGKRPLGRHVGGCEDNIKIDLQEVV